MGDPALPAATTAIVAADWTKQAEPGTHDILSLRSLGTQATRQQSVSRSWAEQLFLGPSWAWVLCPVGDPALPMATAIVTAAWTEQAEPGTHDIPSLRSLGTQATRQGPAHRI